MFEVRRHDAKPLTWWYEQRGKIDFEPSYQRRSELWSPAKQAFLIDSFLNDYDMPKLYLTDFTYASTKLNEHAMAYAVVDGKQRLRAIFKFFDGELRLNDDFVYQDEPDLPLAGLNYFDLKLQYPKIAAKFDKHVPVVMSVITDEKIKVEQLFVRLNSGVHVNRAERRNAMEGIVPDIIRRLVTHRFFTKKIKFNTIRMQDHNLAAKLLLIEHRGGFSDTKADHLDALVDEGLRMDAKLFDQTRVRVVKVLNDMATVFKDRDPLLASEGHIPVYYWLVKHHVTDKEYIRDFLRVFVAAVRANQAVVKEDPKAGDAELSQYYTMGRTTNDQASLSGRYKILERRLRYYLRSKHHSSP
jgi:hypothetical protein